MDLQPLIDSRIEVSLIEQGWKQRLYGRRVRLRAPINGHERTGTISAVTTGSRSERRVGITLGVDVDRLDGAGILFDTWWGDLSQVEILE